MIEYVKDVAQAAETLFLETARASVAANGRFVVVLSGGSTPLELYARLAEAHAGDPFWQDTHVFWGDERFVPHSDSESNYGAAKKALLDRVAVPPENVHPWPYLEGDPEAAATELGDALQPFLNDALFDLTFLGLGNDAHTASLFPATGAVFDEGLTTVVRPPGKEVRLSMTAGTLSRSRTVAFLVQGEGKRDALTRTLSPTENPNYDQTPARAIRAQDEVLWLTDVELTLPETETD